jgi:hypothetical protein
MGLLWVLAQDEVRRVGIHARVVVDGRDRQRIMELAPYVTRPALSAERLGRLEDGRP